MNIVRPRRVNLFCLVISLYWFSLYTYVPTFSTYLNGLGASYAVAGLIIGSYGVAQLLLRIPLGIVSDHLNKRKIFVIAGIIAALISGCGMWLFKDVALTLVFRFLAGVAASTWVTFTVLFSSYYKEEEATKAIGIANSFNSLGQVAAIFLGGLAAQYYGLQAPFLVAFIGAAAALVVSTGISENITIKREPLKMMDLWLLIKNRTLLLTSILGVLLQFIAFATVYGFTPIVAREIGAGSFEQGLLTSLSTLPGVFISALSGTYFATRLGEKKTLILGFVIIAISCIFIPYTPNIGTLYVTQILGGCGRGLVLPLLMGLCIKGVQSNKRATAMGFFQAVYSVGIFLGPVIVGGLMDSIGLEKAFWVTGLIGIVGAAASIQIRAGKA